MTTMMTCRALFLTVIFLLSSSVAADWHRQEATIMGTTIVVELWDEDSTRGRALTEIVLWEMHRIDALMSSYKPDSELSGINSNAAITPAPVSDELLSLITRALEYSEQTGGAFDITYASAGQHYDYRKGEHPDDNQLDELLPSINYKHVRINRENSSVAFLHPDVHIDLGGIAKGYAVDRSIEMLQQAGVTNAMVSAGGDTRVIGKRWGRPWNIGIRDPRNEGHIVSLIPLEDSAISTSGDYERFFEEDGVRYHHILNPGTGKSTHGVHSTSIIGKTATNTDALSTSVFVLGVSKGLALINSLPDTEAVIIDDQGKLHYSIGLEPLARK